MKKLILTAALAAFCVSALAQGTLNFGNANAQVNARINKDAALGGGYPDGAAYIAQLYWGPQGTLESALQPLAGTATFGTGATAGYFFGGQRTFTGVAGGTTITVQVRSWNAAGGSTWELASANLANGEVGKSGLFNVTLSVPPATPANLVGLTPFTIVPVVPEPSSLALVGLGAAALMIFRRRK
jgi:hypothetical protein